VISKQKEKPIVYKSASAIDPFKQKEVSPTQTSRKTGLTHLTPKENPNEEEIGFKITPPGTESRKLGRNDPCWCGSGKKYKKCHYPN
jgi:uncharacterized protein YecA (UPF0149 family)